MRAVVVLGCVAGAFGTSAAPATRPASRPTDPDLYGWWRATDLKGDAVPDASGHGHAAKAVAGKIAKELSGKRTGFRVRPDGGALAVGADGGFDFTADFSVALRVKLTGEQTDVVLMSKRDPAKPDGWAVVHGIRGFGGFGFVAAPRVVVPTPVKAGDDWVHLAVTFQKKDFLLYIDGKAIGVAELPQVPTKSTQPLVIGAGTGGRAAIDGWVDDVRVYHRGLTAEEVEALAAGREPASPYAALTPAAEREVTRLVVELGAGSFAKREAASAKLREMGRPIFPLLRELKETAEGEAKFRLQALLGDLPAEVAPPAPTPPPKGDDDGGC